MQRVWASVLAVWALLALVAVIAWSRPPTPAAESGRRTVVIPTANGGHRTIVLAPPPHATTQTSPASAQQPAAISGQGSSVLSPGPAGGNN
jgi:hypothetical protein